MPLLLEWSKRALADIDEIVDFLEMAFLGL